MHFFGAARGQARGSFRQVSPQSLGGRIAQGHIALLLSFAANQNHFLRPVDVFEVEAGELRIADAASIKQFENGLVARRPTGCIVGNVVDNTIHLLDRGHPRQVLGKARRGNERCDILFNPAGARQPLKPAANGRQRPRRRRLGKPSVKERSQVGADVGVLDAVGGLILAVALHDERGERAQFAFVGTQRVSGGGAFVGEHAQIVRDKLVECARSRCVGCGGHAGSLPVSTEMDAGWLSWSPLLSAELRAKRWGTQLSRRTGGELDHVLGPGIAAGMMLAVHRL